MVSPEGSGGRVTVPVSVTEGGCGDVSSVLVSSVLVGVSGDAGCGAAGSSVSSV
jgi:hypothetical protein